MLRVLIVAPYATVRAGLHALLSGAEGIGVAAETAGSVDLSRILADTVPNVVLYDHGPDDADGVFAAATAAAVPVVALVDERADLSALAGSPAAGIGLLRKDAGAEEIVGAIQAAAAGLVALDPALAPQLLFPAAATVDDPLSAGTLTGREHEVLQLMADGLPNKQIADRLGITLHTVKFHVASILVKMEASSRTEAVTRGARQGLLRL